ETPQRYGAGVADEMLSLTVTADAAPPRRSDLGLRQPAPVLVIVGTTSTLPSDLTEHLLPVLKDVVAVVAKRRGVIVTGGTDAGIFHVLRLALASAPRSPEAVIGVAPAGLVVSEKSKVPPGPDQAVEDGRLSVLVKVTGEAWGDETPMLSRVVADVAGPQ